MIADVFDYSSALTSIEYQTMCNSICLSSETGHPGPEGDLPAVSLHAFYLQNTSCPKYPCTADSGYFCIQQLHLFVSIAHPEKKPCT